MIRVIRARTRRVLVEVSEHHVSGIVINPVASRLRERCFREIIAWHKRGAPQMHTPAEREATEKWLRRDVIYIQVDWQADEVLDGDLRLTPRERRTLRAGWAVRKLVDMETFEAWFQCYATPEG